VPEHSCKPCPTRSRARSAIWGRSGESVWPHSASSPPTTAPPIRTRPFPSQPRSGMPRMVGRPTTSRGPMASTLRRWRCTAFASPTTPTAGEIRSTRTTATSRTTAPTSRRRQRPRAGSPCARVGTAATPPGGTTASTRRTHGAVRPTSSSTCGSMAAQLVRTPAALISFHPRDRIRSEKRPDARMPGRNSDLGIRERAFRIPSDCQLPFIARRH
jgi:hypothetical protein